MNKVKEDYRQIAVSFAVIAGTVKLLFEIVQLLRGK